MAKFRYYITDLDAFSVHGTNDSERARAMADSEAFFVVDSEAGEWMQAGGTGLAIEDTEAPNEQS